MTSQRDELEHEFRRLLDTGALTLPDPAAGSTPERHRRLLEIGRADVQMARVAEAHTDAVAILHEAGRAEAPNALYGVWAAEDPACNLQLSDSRSGAGLVLTGTKAFCTGATILDRSLVTVRRDGWAYLVDLDVRDDPRITFDASGWRASAFAATSTAVATFDDVEIVDADIVGPPGWYLDRVGFWHGACGPAACWAGGAVGLVDHAVLAAARKPADPHRDAHIGALAALSWQLEAMLQIAGQEIDRDPDDVPLAMRRALMLRHNVERAATSIIDLHGRALGPRPLIQEPEVVRRVSEVQLYIRQHHDEHDLESIGRDLRRDATE